MDCGEGRLSLSLSNHVRVDIVLLLLFYICNWLRFPPSFLPLDGNFICYVFIRLCTTVVMLEYLTLQLIYFSSKLFQFSCEFVLYIYVFFFSLHDFASVPLRVL